MNNLKLHHGLPCIMCCDAGRDFDYCRVCGFTVLQFDTDKPLLRTLSPLEQAINKARGGDAPPIVQYGFA